MNAMMAAMDLPRSESESGKRNIYWWIKDGLLFELRVSLRMRSIYEIWTGELMVSHFGAELNAFYLFDHYLVFLLYFFFELSYKVHFVT
jgi:hypothetical protein